MKTLKKIALIGASPVIVLVAVAGYAMATVWFGASRLIEGQKFYE